MARDPEVLVEFYRVGAYVKVSAVDPVTLTEVSIVGAPEAGEAALTRAVVRKLQYVMSRRDVPRRRVSGRS
jgi:hypothetical protein